MWRLCDLTDLFLAILERQRGVSPHSWLWPSSAQAGWEGRSQHSSLKEEWGGTAECVFPQHYHPARPSPPNPIQFFLECPRENDEPGWWLTTRRDKSRHPQGLHWAACIVLGAAFTPSSLGWRTRSPGTSEELALARYKRWRNGWMDEWSGGQAKEVLVSACVCCVCVMHSGSTILFLPS